MASDARVFIGDALSQIWHELTLLPPATKTPEEVAREQFARDVAIQAFRLMRPPIFKGAQRCRRP